MSDTPPKAGARKGRFTKGDPRTKLGGRRKKSVSWKSAEEELREALPRILLMSKTELRELLEKNPSGAEMLAAKYLHEHVAQAVDKFLGKTPQPLTGAEGKPLIPPPAAPLLPDLHMDKWEPEQLNAFIAATAALAAAAGKKPGA